MFADFGLTFEAYEADFGRTFVPGKRYFAEHGDIIGKRLYTEGGRHAGHLVREFPHETIDGADVESNITPGNETPLLRTDVVPAGSGTAQAGSWACPWCQAVQSRKALTAAVSRRSGPSAAVTDRGWCGRHGRAADGVMIRNRGGSRPGSHGGWSAR